MNYSGKLCRRLNATSALRRLSGKPNVDELSKHRNIGILAHVDAGKTTTTERLLFYSGQISAKGEVHHGNTVTDYMTQERERGISIASAFVQLNWRDRILNLVDTPGHIDFTAEVENALGVIDSAILLLDGSAGVEAQTLTVWRQIQNRRLPCLVYVNKMDRTDVDVDLCLSSLETKLNCRPIPLQIPSWSNKRRFVGIIDLPTMTRLIFDDKNGRFDRIPVLKDDDNYDEVVDKRNQLVDSLSTHDDELADDILEKGSLEAIDVKCVIDSIKKVTIRRQAVPVIYGSSYKDVAVQPLLDSIVDYLPSPVDNPFASTIVETFETFVKSFKVIHDKHRGPVTYLRLYSGRLSKNQRIFNATKKETEIVGRILIPFADDFEEIAEATSGQFVAVTGLKVTHPGDVLTTSSSSLKRAHVRIKERLNLGDDEVDTFMTLTDKKASPVFFCSVEPSSQSVQLALDKALAELQREDSSLGVTQDEETGQTILSGMGELHLDIVRDRLRTNYKLDVDIGRVQIVYKERLLNSGSSSYHLVNAIGSQKAEVTVELSLKPSNSTKLLILDKTPEAAANLAHVTPKQVGAVERGVKMSLARGPILGYKVVNVQATLSRLEAKRYVPDQFVTAAASNCVRQILTEVPCSILEPIMSVDVTVPDDKSHLVLGDLGRRRAEIVSVDEKGGTKFLKSLVPLSQLVGYSTDLRTITSGTASLLITFAEYRPITDDQVEQLINFNVPFKKFR